LIRRAGLRLPVCDALEVRRHHVLLRDQQRTHLKQLVGLLAGELVCIADGLNLAVDALSAGLKKLELPGIGFHRLLLMIDGAHHGVDGPFLRLGCDVLGFAKC
jgi:hypothetical protein